MTEVALREDGQAPVTAAPQRNLVSLIEQIVQRPDIDIDKVEKLVEMQFKAEQRAAERAFYYAMSDMQKELPVIEHTKQIGYEDKNTKEFVSKGTYTPWEDIDEQVRPIYTRFGFSLSFEVNQSPNGPIVVIANVMHKDGHMRSTKIELPSDPSGKKNNVQAVGSAITYGKRYAACSAMNITTREVHDDGGEAAGQPMTPAQAREHNLWQTLSSELMNECETRSEAETWLAKTKQFRTEYHSMPMWWRGLFFEEVYLRRLEDLPEVTI